MVNTPAERAWVRECERRGMTQPQIERLQRAVYPAGARTPYEHQLARRMEAAGFDQERITRYLAAAPAGGVGIPERTGFDGPAGTRVRESWGGFDAREIEQAISLALQARQIEGTVFVLYEDHVIVEIGAEHFRFGYTVNSGMLELAADSARVERRWVDAASREAAALPQPVVSA